MEKVPTVDDVRRAGAELASRLVRTPVVRCGPLEDGLGDGTRIWGKLEFLQRTGTFKARGALAFMARLDGAGRQAGVTAVSAGNHAIATAYAASAFGVSAKVVMIRTANPARIRACEDYGAEIVLADDVHSAFEIADKIQKEEGRRFVHPFEGESVALGTGLVGLEMCEQVDAFDTLIVPIGGGGLIAGISNVVKRLRPDVTIVGVEPEGADTMARSIAAGTPQSIAAVRTIADSLGAPYALPYSFELTRSNVDRFCRVTEAEIRDAMGLLFHRQKFVVEPACAASTAALLGPLRKDLVGERVLLLFCGSNIDRATWSSQANLEKCNVD
jgi:threonine dehydratase